MLESLTGEKLTSEKLKDDEVIDTEFLHYWICAVFTILVPFLARCVQTQKHFSNKLYCEAWEAVRRNMLHEAEGNEG